MLGVGEGLDAACLERLVCLASGVNYSPCWASISVSEGRENNLSNSSSQSEAGPWGCTQLGSSPPPICPYQVQQRKCSGENRKALPAKWENRSWTSVMCSVLSLQQFSYNYAVAASLHHMVGHWLFCRDINLICSVDVCLFINNNFIAVSDSIIEYVNTDRFLKKWSILIFVE